MIRKFQSGFAPVAVCLLALLLTGCSAGMKASWHLRRANHYYAAGQFDQAEIEYLNVVRNNPENFLAISRLGEIYYSQGRMQNASQFLYRARQLNTNDLPVRVRLGQLYQSAGRLPDARDEARFVLDHQPENADAPLTLAEAADGPPLELANTKLLAPIDDPQKFLAIGMNYQAHADEAAAAGIPVPTSQLWFNKQVSCIACRRCRTAWR